MIKQHLSKYWPLTIDERHLPEIFVFLCAISNKGFVRSKSVIVRRSVQPKKMKIVRLVVFFQTFFFQSSEHNIYKQKKKEEYSEEINETKQHKIS